MNIGDVAKASGVSAKLIRHYEEIGVISKAGRTDAGYRQYTEKDIHNLRFVKRARSLGFAMKDIKLLLGLWRNKNRSSLEVKTLATNHIRDLEGKIQEMQEMVMSLKHLSRNCHGDSRPDCPILEGLAK